MPIPPLPVPLAAACLAIAHVHAQGRVHKVDPTSASAFAEIDAAIAAAAAGDVIVVATKPRTPGIEWSNLYRPIRIDKSLAITSDNGQDVRCWSVEIVGLAPQDHAVVRGIQFERPTLLVSFGLPTLAVTNCSGHVFLEDCSFQPASPLVVGVGATIPAVDIAGPSSGARGSVTFARCTIRGVSGANNPRSVGQQQPAPGIRATDTDLALWESVVTGGDGVPAYPQLRLPAGPGADGMLFDGRAFLSGSVVRGGDGGDATAITCSTAGNGGNGLVLVQATTLVETLACTLAGGNPGSGCPNGAPGAAELRGAAGLVHLPGAATSLRATSPHRVGQATTLEHQGVQGAAFVGFASTAPGFLRTTPFVLGVHCLGGPGAGQPLYAGTYGSGGQTLLPVPLPPTGRQGLVLLLQSAALVPPHLPAHGAPTALFVLAANL